MDRPLPTRNPICRPPPDIIDNSGKGFGNTGKGLGKGLGKSTPQEIFATANQPFVWTGVYIGPQFGGAWGRDSGSLFDREVRLGSFSLNPQGVIGGGHVGYNWQANPWVFGLEGSVDGTSLSRSRFDEFSGITWGIRSNIQGSIRGRFGLVLAPPNPDWLCLGRFLFYATGGAAFAGFTNNYTFGALEQSEGFSKTRVGWTVGGGFEYALTNNWSIRTEYRYSDFGRNTDFAFASVPGGPLSVQHHWTQHQVQGGLSYKIGF